MRQGPSPPHLRSVAALRGILFLFLESRRLQLSPEEIATAEAVGVTFLPATPAQVQRLAMQRKIFYAAGQPTLATRGDGFYETAGTLQRLLEEGQRQQHDLSAWQRSQTPSPAPAEAGVAERAAAGRPAAPVEVVTDQEASRARPQTEREAPPKRLRRSRRPAPLASLPAVPAVEAAPEPALPLQAESGEATAAAARSRQAGQRQRWVVAGAERRGRAAKHWSVRQR